MELDELIGRATNFDAMTPREQIALLAWHIHSHRKLEVVTYAAVRDCFRALNVAPPDVTVYMPRMAETEPRELLRTRSGFKLAGHLRRSLEARYGNHPTVVMVSNLLSDLPAKVPDLAERTFLKEAIDCYRVAAYRAAIVMTWNLAFDHLIAWLVRDVARLNAFNSAIGRRYPKKSSLTITAREDFEELKESETIEVCYTAKLIARNVTEVLREKLKRRNMAAHPSQIVVNQPQADDAITDLVNNVVLALH
jgi:hypothetical protein